MNPRILQKLFICGMTAGVLVAVAGLAILFLQASWALHHIFSQSDWSPPQVAVKPAEPDAPFGSIHTSYHFTYVTLDGATSCTGTVGLCVGGVIFTACLLLYRRGERRLPPPLPGVRRSKGPTREEDVSNEPHDR